MTVGIGDRRTFFLKSAWWLPDLLLVIAGPFAEWLFLGMACRCQIPASRFCLTKRLSKPSLLKQRRAGYRPPARTRILDEPNGLPEQSVSRRQLRNEGEHSDRQQRLAVGKMVRRATAERSPAQATERGAGGDRRSTDDSAWDSRKAHHASWAERRRLPPRQAGFRRAGTRTS